MLSVIKFKLHSNLNISDSHSREEYLQSLKMEQHICIDTLDLKKSKYDEDLLVESLKVIPERVDYYLPRAISIDISTLCILLI